MERVYELTKEEVLKNVPNKKGIYFLGDIKDGKFVVGYVGRSDSSLKRRLLGHNHFNRFKFFCFKTVKSMREGYILETEYCYLNGNKIINKIHPNSPKNISVEAPVDVLGRHLKKRFMEVAK